MNIPSHQSTKYDSSCMEFDPFGEEFRSDPDRWYNKLLGSSPGFISMEGVPSAFVSTQAHCMSVLRDFKRFSSEKPKGLPGMDRVDYFNGQRSMNYSDPPVHNRLRKVMNGAFQPKRMEQMIESMKTVIEELLDPLEPGSEVDFVEHVTKPLVTKFIFGEFLGFAEHDHRIMLDYIASWDALDKMKPGDPRPREFTEAWNEGILYCRSQIDLASKGNTDNIIHTISSAYFNGSIDESELMAMMVLLYIGGITSIPSAAGTCLLNIARNSGIAEQINAEPDLANRVLEESLRLDPPVMNILRFAVEDVDFNGVTIPSGMPVYVMVSAACHDPATWPDPMKFDLSRPNLQDSIAFGYGIHTCMGNALTRLLVPLFVREVARKFPQISIRDSECFGWKTTPRTRDLSRLQLHI